MDWVDWVDLRRVLSALLALACGLAGGILALAHPISPMLALAGFYAAAMVALWLPGIWLFAVPACLPWLNFAPWTGWQVVDEFDGLLLAVLAAGYGHLASLASRPYRGAWTRSTTLLAVLFGASLLALVRGVLDAGGLTLGWFQGYADPLNSLRIFKSLLWASLCIPLLQDALRSAPQRVGPRLAAGMLVGLASVALAVLWERAAFPGLFNFTSTYRTTALFWEMHVGGAALDGYLALATPFVVWALRSARRPWQWALGALLALLVAYAGLTSFSRGVYAAMVLPLLLLALLLWLQQAGLDLRAMAGALWQRRRPHGWRSWAAWALGCALLAEVLGVLHGGDFMADRLARTERDFGSRVAHWQRGLGLLRTPMDVALGIGLGRLPSHYARSYPEGEWPGHAAWLPGGQTPPRLLLSGPDSDADLGDLFGLAQRVPADPGERYRVTLRVRVAQPVDLYLQLCERHLLYNGRCQDAFVQLEPQGPQGLVEQAWQQIAVPLEGPRFKGAPWYTKRPGLFSVSVLSAGAQAEFASIRLAGRNGHGMLANPDFAQNLAHWLPAARAYFLPWHIDNLLLEVLVERGVLGLLLWAALVGTALWALVLGRARHHPLAPYLAASLCGILLVGLVSSVMDVPRVAFLLFWLLFYAQHLGRDAEP